MNKDFQVEVISQGTAMDFSSGCKHPIRIDTWTLIVSDVVRNEWSNLSDKMYDGIDSYEVDELREELSARIVEAAGITGDDLVKVKPVLGRVFAAARYSWANTENKEAE